MSIPTEPPLSGRLAVVTGASGGIGSTLCDGLADAGARVIGVDREVNAREGFPHDYMECDLADPEAIAGLAARVRDQHGAATILVNTAGIARESKALDMSIADWDDVMDVNARGLFLTSREFGKDMAVAGYGKIVNFASRCGLLGYPNFISYNASKAAVISITQTLAVELATDGVRVNAVAPGFISTPMTQYAAENKELHSSLVSRIPMGRFGRPDEVVGTIVYLASPASDYVTGVTIPLDGGMTAY